MQSPEGTGCVAGHTKFARNGLKLAYIVGTYPSLTTTFIDREVNALRALGIPLGVLSLRRPKRALSPEQEIIGQSVSYLLPVRAWPFLLAHLRYAFLRPGKYFRTLLHLLTRPHPDAKSRFMTFLHFQEGVAAARVIERGPTNHIHAHFVDRAATVALVAGRLLDIPYSVTAHANDIYIKPVLLKEKIRHATFAATCTEFNRVHLNQLVGATEGQKVVRIYHGLDLDSFPEPRRAWNAPHTIIAVGQLKEKKGFGYLLKACRRLEDRGRRFRCEIIGEGPLRSVLEEQVRELKLREKVTLCGALPHQEVVAKYAIATMFVLPCVISADGDRDGIPNVILEAMAMRVPVISTRHSGIPEVIQDGVNGILVPPADDAALADAIGKLLDNPEERFRLGESARRTVMAQFDINSNVCRLLERFAGGSTDFRAAFTA